MNLKETYSIFINESSGAKAEHSSSYMGAIDILDSIIRRKAAYLLNEESIWEITSAKHIEKIYEFVLNHQNLGQDGVFSEEEPVRYWRDHLCSEALNNYKDFLLMHFHLENLQTTFFPSQSILAKKRGTLDEKEQIKESTCKSEVSHKARSIFETLPRNISRKYSSILGKLESIYGEGLTEKDFLGISEKDFASRRGIGGLNVKRFRDLKLNIIKRNKFNFEVTVPDFDFEKWDIPIEGVPDEFSVLYMSLKHHYEVKTYADILAVDVDVYKNLHGVGVQRCDLLCQWKRLILEFPPVAIDNGKFNIPIESVPDEFSVLYMSLKHHYAVETYADILAVDVEGYKKLRGIGKRRLELLCQWKRMILESPPHAIDKARLELFRINYSALNKGERGLFIKLMRRDTDIDDITPHFLIELSPEELLSRKGFGRKNAIALAELQGKIKKELLKKQDEQILLIPLDFGVDLCLADTSRCILEDVDNFLRRVKAEDRDIFCKRFGWREEFMTLNDLGELFKVTRERVRQKEKKVIFSLCQSVRISPNILESKISAIPVSDLFEEMSCLRHAFCTDSAFIRLLTILADIDGHEFLQKISPSIPLNALDDFFCTENLPVLTEKAKEYLQEELGMEEEVVSGALNFLKDEGRILFEGKFVYPRSAKKEVAITCVLSMYPEGLDWKDIAEKVNGSGFCHTTLSIERPDPVLHTSSYIYQSEKSHFSHLRYLGLSKSEIQFWIDNMKKFLERTRHRSLHLRAEYYATLPEPKPDYYKIRYVARNFGASGGVYFQGKSQADTISLEHDAELVSQLDALARKLAEKPMTIEEITGNLHSQSEGHAWSYIGNLLSEGKAVRLDDGTYASSTIAFSDIDIDKVLEAVHFVFNGDNRPHHLGALTSQVNRISGMRLTPKLFRALILANMKKEKFVLRGYLVSKSHIKWSGLADTVRDAPSLKGEDLIAWVQQRVCASREAVKRAISNSGVESEESEDIGFPDGLASDFMKELFEL